MPWNKLKFTQTAVVVLAFTNLLTLLLLLHQFHWRHPGRSKPEANLTITVERIPTGESTPDFKFTKIPPPSRTDAATAATFSLISGGQSPHDWKLYRLHDGLLPGSPDSPDENFFFNDGSYGGRIIVDLNQAIDIRQINTYSWHKSDRGPQLYKLYAREAILDGSPPEAVGYGDPAAVGWKYLALVDTRPKSGDPGGQYGVSITSPTGLIGHYRYLLLDCKRNEEVDRWGNTFYSELDVIAK